MQPAMYQSNEPDVMQLWRFIQHEVMHFVTR